MGIINQKSRLILSHMQDNNVTVSEWIRIPSGESYTTEVLDSYLDRIIERGRSTNLLFLCERIAFLFHSERVQDQNLLPSIKSI